MPFLIRSMISGDPFHGEPVERFASHTARKRALVGGDLSTKPAPKGAALPSVVTVH